MLAHPNQDPSAAVVLPCLATLMASLGKGRRAFYLAHRLDQETSGVLLAASSPERAAFLGQEFRARRVAKVYLALCHGVPPAERFSEAAPLTAIDRQTGRVQAGTGAGRPALTHFCVLGQAPAQGVSLLACWPHTGRTHQIRAHLACHGLGLVGDKRYGLEAAREAAGPEGRGPLPHHLLHAFQLRFRPGPGLPAVTVAAPLPPLFLQVLTAAGLLAAVAALPAGFDAG